MTKQKLEEEESDDLRHQKNSSTVTSMQLSFKIKSITDKLVSEELAEQGNVQTKKDYFIEIAEQFQIEGVSKEDISMYTLLAIEERLFKKLSSEGIPREQCKLSASSIRHLKRTMAEIGFTNPFYARNKNNSNDDDDSDYSKNFTMDKNYPEGEEFEILELLARVSKNNYDIIIQLQKKLIYDKNFILKNKKSKIDDDITKRLVDAKKLIDKRRNVTKEQIIQFSKNNIPKTKTTLLQLISSQNKLFIHFDDRCSITHWQKIMALLSVMIGYDKNEISRFLNITTKHMKVNIYSEDARYELLLLLKWFDRCPNPNCGVNLSEFFAQMIIQYKKGTLIDEIRDFELEPLITTGYQKENLKLITQNIKLKSKLSKRR